MSERALLGGRSSPCDPNPPKVWKNIHRHEIGPDFHRFQRFLKTCLRLPCHQFVTHSANSSTGLPINLSFSQNAIECIENVLINTGYNVKSVTSDNRDLKSWFESIFAFLRGLMTIRLRRRSKRRSKCLCPVNFPAVGKKRVQSEFGHGYHWFKRFFTSFANLASHFCLYLLCPLWDLPGNWQIGIQFCWSCQCCENLSLICSAHVPFGVFKKYFRLLKKNSEGLAHELVWIVAAACVIVDWDPACWAKNLTCKLPLNGDSGFHFVDEKKKSLIVSFSRNVQVVPKRCSSDALPPELSKCVKKISLM